MRPYSIQDVFRICLLVTVVMALGAYALGEAQPLLAVGLVIPAVGGWWMTEWRSRRTPGAPAWGIPRLAASLLLVGMLLGAGLHAWETREVVSAFSAFLCAIVILKLWEKREASDYGQLLTMSSFLAIGAVLTGTSLAMGLALVVMTPFLAVAGMLFQVIESERRAGMLGATPWRSLAKPLSTVAGLSLVVGLLVSLTLFVLVPRGIGADQFGRWGGVPVGRTTGFAGQVDLQRGGFISESQATVMEVRLYSDGMAQNIGGEGLPIYLRGVALTEYDRGRWERGEEPKVQRIRRQTSQPMGFDTSTGGSVERVIEVTPRRAGSRATPLFTVNRPVSIELIDLLRSTDLMVEQGPAVISGVEGGWPRMYTVRFALRGVSQSERLAAMNPVGAARTPVSFPVPRVQETARSVLTAANVEPDPDRRTREQDRAAARAIELFLQSRFTYTLEGPIAPLREDPTDWFLHEGKKGHCEHFASAMAAMCRSVGINARVMAGYLCGEFDPAIGAYIVREADAHAWVEVDLGQGFWETYDPTPPSELSALQAAQRRTFFSRIARALDFMQATWDGSVISFDQSTRERLLGTSSNGIGLVERGLVNLASTLQPLRASVGAGPWWGLLFVAMVVVPLAILIFVMRAIFSWYRTWSMGAAGGFAFTAAQARLRDRLLSALRRRGHRKPAWMPLNTFAEQVANADPQIAPAVLDAAAALVDARFGSGGQEALARCAAGVKQIRQLPQA